MKHIRTIGFTMKLYRTLNSYKSKLTTIYVGRAPAIHEKAAFSYMSDFPVHNLSAMVVFVLTNCFICNPCQEAVPRSNPTSGPSPSPFDSTATSSWSENQFLRVECAEGPRASGLLKLRRPMEAVLHQLPRKSREDHLLTCSGRPALHWGPQCLS